MGRASNYKWYKRNIAYLRAHIAEQLHWARLFGRHRKFNP